MASVRFQFSSSAVGLGALADSDACCWAPELSAGRMAVGCFGAFWVEEFEVCFLAWDAWAFFQLKPWDATSLRSKPIP